MNKKRSHAEKEQKGRKKKMTSKDPKTDGMCHLSGNMPEAKSTITLNCNVVGAYPRALLLFA